MKTSKLLLASAILAGGMTLAGCSEEALQGGANSNNPAEFAKWFENAFDYSTWEKYTLDIDLGRPGKVDIFAVDPTINPNAEPIDGALIDYTGKYSRDIVLSSSLVGQELWARTGDGVVKGKLTKKGISFNFPAPQYAASRAFATPTDPWYDTDIIYAGGMEPEGFTTDYPTLCSELEKYYHDLLPQGDDENAEFLRHNNEGRDLEMTVDDTPFNRTMVTNYGGIPIRSSMIDYGDGSQEQYYDKGYMQMYYYYYKRTDTERSIKEIYDNPVAFAKKFINDKFRICCRDEDDYHSCIDHGPGKSYTKNRQSLGYTVPLFYYGDDYAAEMPAQDSSTYDGSYNFPIGVTIGVFMLVKSYSGELCIHFGNNNGGYVVGNAEQTGTYDYDAKDPGNWEITWLDETVDEVDRDWNGTLDDKSNSDCYAAVFKFTDASANDRSNNKTRFLFSFEDQWDMGDKDCDDEMMVLSVRGDMYTDIIPAYTRWVREGVYVFEDNYPVHGDYDMNDAVIKYKYTAVSEAAPLYDTKDAPIMKITAFKYELEVINNGATYANDFYMGYKASSINEYKLIFPNCVPGSTYRGEASYEEDGETVKEGSDEFATKMLGGFVEHLLNNDYQGQVGSYEEGNWSKITINGGLSPFIHCRNTGYQVHQPGYEYIEGVGNNNSSLGDKLRFYQIEYGENGAMAPFSMDISDNGKGAQQFIVVPEKMNIGTFYPEYVLWVESQGATNTDWWKHPETSLIPTENTGEGD